MHGRRAGSGAPVPSPQLAQVDTRVAAEAELAAARRSRAADGGAAAAAAAGLRADGAPAASRRATRVRVKFITMGEVGCGKSSLIKRFCEDRFTTKHVSTIGIDFGVKPVALGGFDVRLNIWDMAGAKEWYLVRREFYADSQAALVVYDPAKRATFDKLDEWWAEAKRHGAERLQGVLVSTKADKGGGAVDRAEAQAWADRHGLDFVDCSALTGDGVQAAVMTLLARVLDGMPGKEAAAAAAREKVREAGSGAGAAAASRGRRRAG